MKKALSCKFVLLIIAFALSIALAFSFYGLKPAYAADISSADIANYFSGAESFDLDGDNLKATVNGDNHSVSITNKLVVDDLAIELNVPAEISSFKIIFTYDSYFVNGAYNAEADVFDNVISNSFTFTATGDIKLEFSTSNNVLSAKIGAETQSKDDIYYKIKGADKCAAEIAFDFTLADETVGADIIFKSIDQKATDGTGAYKQTFTLNEDKIATLANPRVIINDLPLVKNGDDLNAIVGKKYSLSFTAYSVFGNVASGAVYIDKDSVAEDVWVDPSTEQPKSIIFETENATAITFELRTADIEAIETYSVVSVDRETYVDDNLAPKYIDYTLNENVYAWYKTLVEKAAVKEYTIDEDTTITRSIRLGDTYEIPSLQDLVYDDYDLYSSLTYTVYYRTPSNASGQTSSLKFTVSEAGDYEFYVAFKDVSGKAMEKDDFYKLNDDGIPDYTDCDYKNAVFTFTVNDDAPISVEAPKTQGKGYLNTKYVATGFKILSGDNEVYTLYFNPDNNATSSSEGWIKLPNLTDIAVDYNENGFTYSDIENLAYDGKYTFTPVKVGAYKIECYVSSGNAVRYAEGETVISVSDAPTVVKVPSHWLRDNVWSVVFLSIGTLSLIGIIVLLFIKPKEEVETDETGDALNLNAKK